MVKDALNVLFLLPEVIPFARSGGLAHVAGIRGFKPLRLLTVVFVLALAVFSAPATCPGAEAQRVSPPEDVLIVSGVITNAQGKGVEGAAVAFYADGKRIDIEKRFLSEGGGIYRAELSLPQGTLPGGKITVGVKRPGYEDSGPVPLENILKEKTDGKGTSSYLAQQSIALKRTMGPAFWIASSVLILVYISIALELMHRALAALFGAAMMLLVSYTAGSFNGDYLIFTFEQAIRAIDMNVILLLMAMMLIVGVLKKTGLFQWMAFRSYQVARGNVFALSVILMFLTALISAFLDNVTTMILIIPVTINIAEVLKISPLTLLLPEVFAANIGGTSTLIGDPPNIMIGSYANLTFMDFVQHLTLISSISLAVTMVYFVYWYKKDYLKAEAVDVKNMIGELRESYRITDKRLLVQSLLVLGITIFLFFIQGALHMEPSIAAMAGASILLVISRVKIVEMLEHEIEWPTIIFFMMLFIIVAGAEETGLIQVIADWVRYMSGGSMVVAVLVILWVSALASSIIDNIPFTATMLPIVAYLNQSVPGAESGILWWALALGACLGGNGTLIGASANVVTVGIAEGQGYRISFMEYTKIVFVPMIITIVLCTIWLLLGQM
jgi:Na+/H+ antiporter NhaD/arsenite permease-like protein